MSRVSLGDRAVRVALRCYPDWWRDRYGGDQEALVEDLEAEQSGWAWRAFGAWRLAASLILGAMRSRSNGSGMPAVPELWQRRTRSAIVAASVPAVLAVPLALLLIGYTGEYGRSAPGGVQSSMQLSGAGRVAQWEVLILILVTLASIVHVVAGAIRSSRQLLVVAPRRRRALIVVAVLAPVVAIGGGFAMLHFSFLLKPVISGTEKVRGHTVRLSYSYRGHPLASRILAWAGWTGIVGGWVGGAVVLARMVTRRVFPVGSLRAGVGHARVATMLQAGAAFVALVLSVTLPLQQPIGPDGGMIYRSALGAWTPVIAAALLAVALFTGTAARTACQAIARASEAG